MTGVIALPLRKFTVYRAAHTLLTPWSKTPHGVTNRGESAMLRWAVVFFVVAIIAAIFGFGGIAASAAGIAKVLFVVFLVVAVVSLLLGRRAAI
jgi:uncharacterized membrane protein YtjA (UPF0391 family)